MKVSALAVRAWENSLARLQWVRDGLIRATALNQQDQQKQIAILDAQIAILKENIKNAKENEK